MNKYINSNLDKNEKLIDYVNINTIIRIPYYFIFIFLIIMLFNISFLENPYLFFLILAITICIFIDLLKIAITIDTTELGFTNKRFIGKKGWLKTLTLDAPLNKINDIMIKQNFLGKIFNYSTIVISTSSSRYIYDFIKNAQDFKNSYHAFYNSKNENKEIANNSSNKYEDLEKLKKLLDAKIITNEEFEKEKTKILNQYRH